MGCSLPVKESSLRILEGVFASNRHSSPESAHRLLDGPAPSERPTADFAFAIITSCADPQPEPRKRNMPTDIVMPQMGESIFEGTITKWLKKPGDKIQRDEPLFEISTDKVDAEIPAPASGVLSEIKVTEGTTVQVNTVVGTISSDGEGAAVKSAAEKKPAPDPAAQPATPVSELSHPSKTA